MTSKMTQVPCFVVQQSRFDRYLRFKHSLYANFCVQQVKISMFTCFVCTFSFFFKFGRHFRYSGRNIGYIFFPFTAFVLFLAAPSKRTVRVRERLTVVPRCVLLGGYYCNEYKGQQVLSLKRCFHWK